MAQKNIHQFNKTHLAKEVQNAAMREIIGVHGAQSLLSAHSAQDQADKDKTLSAADGVKMGYQVEKNVIPIVYGITGMSNAHFDKGQTISELEPEYAVQAVRIPVSEGPIVGIAYRDEDEVFTYSPEADNAENFKNVTVNNRFVIDPETEEAAYSDIVLEMTKGDGAGVTQTATITDYNPLLYTEEDDVKIDPITTIKTKLNDLADVNAIDKGINYVLFWNGEESEWQSKSFNDLMRETDATADGGTGGAGGQGGEGGDGGTGGTGGTTGPDGILYYTQFNPPPHHIKNVLLTETSVTEPEELAATTMTDGAPLRNRHQTTPEFSSEVTWKDVTEVVDSIKLTTVFPDGIYKEITTITHTDGPPVLCDTIRPPLGGFGEGDLECLEPDIDIDEEWETATTRTRVDGSVTVHYVLTTTLCGREFVLDQNSYDITHFKNGRYQHTQTLPLTAMNAGLGTRDDGVQQIGPFEGEADCESLDVEDYPWANYTLDDYLQMYPGQILDGTNTIKVYAWIENRLYIPDEGEYAVGEGTWEYKISTNTFLSNVTICDPIDSYEGLYQYGDLTASPFFLNGPDHDYQWFGNEYEVGTEGYSIGLGRCDTDVISGTFGAFSYPEPLLILDGTVSGGAGAFGTHGMAGDEGLPGEPGTEGPITVPDALPIPTVVSANSSYSSEEYPFSATLAETTVSHEDATEVVTLTIRLIDGTAGTLDVNTVTSGVGAIGRNTSTLTLDGTVANLQATLNSGLVYSTSVTASGDKRIDFFISGVNGNSREEYEIKDISQRLLDLDLSRLGSDWIDSYYTTLEQSNVAWAEIRYRPPQDKQEIHIQELGLIVAGRLIDDPIKNGVAKATWLTGSSTPVWSENTAFVLYDYLTNTDFGLGAFWNSLTTEQQASLKEDIYDAGNWCAVEPDGTLDVASTFNGVIYGAESKWEMAQKIASRMNGKIVFQDGGPRLVLDAFSYTWTGADGVLFEPVVSVMVNQSSAMSITYNGGSVDNVYNIINVAWNNPENNYQLEFLQYRNENSITQLGERETTIELVGCSNKQQALWQAAWIYESERVNCNTVTYIATWDHHNTKPGDLIIFKDTDRPGSIDIGGRVVADNGNGTLTLDRDAGTGNIAVMDNNGEVVFGSVSGNIATVAGSFTAGTAWNVYISAEEDAPNYRIIAIEETEDGIYAVTAQKHDTNKYDRIWANLI